MSDHQRTEPSRTADERTSLTGFLQYQRETLALKCAGLTTEQLREKAVPPSGLSLLGLIRHVAEVERSWFQVVWNGEDVRAYWPGTVHGTFAEFDSEAADPDEAFAVWRAASARSQAIVEAAESLDATVQWRAEVFSLRYVLTHMIEEYARHNGHADLLRERIDGTTGE
ncbi:DinB family protein [Streptomyces sp. AK02-01A]|uniref:DinB family protein n=1 Tax=Streptomyces sp. AK02-01A TaxID=3028648 RepID=UPI0029A5CBB5|nr:DinB family protein [Streptomyces sp. AK02-01A]MDX3854959.1 DinB family protein [Streptomyces sp. AK02-01A]